MTQDERIAIWRSRINDYRTSNEGAATWCERHQVTPRQLWYWMRKLRKLDEQTPAAGHPQWVSLHVNDLVSDSVAPVAVRIGAATIEVRSGFDPSLLAAVVRTLKTLC